MQNFIAPSRSESITTRVLSRKLKNTAGVRNLFIDIVFYVGAAKKSFIL